MRSSVSVPRTVGFSVANLYGADQIGDFSQHHRLDDGQRNRARIFHGMSESIDPVAVDEGDGPDGAECQFAQQQTDRQRPAGRKACLALHRQTGGNRVIQETNALPVQLDPIETGTQQWNVQGHNAFIAPRGRAFGQWNRSPFADDPFHGRGEKSSKAGCPGA